MARNTFTKAEVMILLNGQGANNQLEELRKRSEKLTQQLAEMGDVAQLDEKGLKTWENLERELTTVNNGIKKLGSSMKSTADIVNDLSGSSLRQLRDAAKDLRKQINELSEEEMEKLPRLLTDLAKVENQIEKIEGKVSETKRTLSGVPDEIEKSTVKYNDQSKSIKTAVAELGKYILTVFGLQEALGKAGEAFNKNIALSDTLADVRKATGLTKDEVNALSTALQGLDTRTTLEGLNELAYAGGRMGIQGADNLLQFVKAADQLNVALSEDLGEGAIETLTKMADIMGLTQSMGYEKSLLSLGSAINTLTSTSVAAGGPMVDMLARLAGIGVQSQLSADELLALSATADTAGLRAESASTALSQFIIKLKTDTESVAKAAGVSASELKALVDEGKTMDAIVATFEGLSKKGGIEALAPVMKDLGGEGSRVIGVISSMVGKVDDLKTMLDTSRKSFAQATSVTEEYNVKNENAAALLQRMKNSIEETFVNSKMVERIEGFLRTLMELPTVVEKNKTTIIAALIAITAALTRVEFKVNAIFRLGLGKSLAVLGKRILALGGPIKSLFALIAANPWTVALTAIGLFTAAMVDGARKADHMGQAMKRVKKLSKENADEIGKETVRVSQLFDWLKRAEKGTENYEKAKQTILSNYGQYLKGMGDEIEKLEDIEGAYNAITIAATNAAKARMAEKGLTSANEAYASTTGDIYTNIYDTMEKQTTGRFKNKQRVYSDEEIDSFVTRLRPIIDMGGEIPAEMQSIIDSFTRTVTYTGTGGYAQTVQVNPLQAYVDNLRNAKRALDAEVKEVEQRFGKLEEILPGTGVDGNNNTTTTTTTTTTVETPEEKKRKALQAAKAEQQASLDALEIFYKQQEQVINEQYLNREITDTEREKRLAENEKRMLESRIAARRALLGEEGAQEEWQAMIGRMDAANIATSEENATALATLYGKNLQDIGERLRKFGDNEMDGIRKNMEQDRLTIQNNAIQMRQEVERILIENDFTGKVTQQYMEAMQKLGIFFPEMEEDMKASAEWLMQGLHEIYPKIFDVDILTDAGLNAFRNMILNAKGATVEMAMMGEEQMRLLYYQILEYGDAMENANRQARKAGQRVTEEKWRKSGGLETTNRLSAEEKHINSMNSMLSGVGLMSDEVANDALIELYAKRVEALEKLRDLTIQNNGDIEDANKKLEEAMNQLSEAVVDKTLTMLETLKSFTDTLPEFGDALGEAFATEDATERMEALQEATKDFVQDLGEATKEMIVQWVKQKIQHALLKKSMVSTEKQTQGEITDTQQEGTEAQTAIAQVGGTLMQNIASKVKDFVVGKKKEQAAESVSTEASETSANATMGIASGAAKTVGELGWWGIPLVAVITALLNGLLSYAMGKVGNLFSGKSAEATAAPAATGKVVSGMLAYDSGNVQSVLGSDGNTYAARVGGIGSGSGIVTVPTLTNVGGQAALVGEQGPEVVIGRATTKALMQNNPGLLQGLIQFDRLHSGRGFRTYDNGNIGEFGMGTDGDTMKDLKNILTEMVATNKRLNNRLDKGIGAHIVRKELVEETVNGMYEEKQRGNNKNLKRLLG